MADNNHFVALSECHFMNPESMEEMSYYPGYERWWKSIDGVMRAWGGDRDLSGGDSMPEPRAHALKEWMDKSNVDVCFALRESMMDVSGYSTCMSTNAFMLKEIEPYTERMYLEANCGPIIRRGVDHAIWELEYLFKERNAKLCKVYAPEDGPLNDKRLWPFYEKACELDIALTVHTGMSYVCPQPSKFTHPSLLDDVCLDFPELKLVMAHGADPWWDVAIRLMLKYHNLYMMTSAYLPKYLPTELLHFMNTRGKNKVMWASDHPAIQMKRCLKEAQALGVKVSLVYPGGTDTEFRPKARPDYMRPESVAETVHALLTLPADVIVQGITFRPLVETNF